jgi:hypothetical protein
MVLAMVASARSHRLWGWKALLQIKLEWQRSPLSGSFLWPETHVVVVHVGRLSWPLVHRLANSIVVRPLDRHAVARGGGWHPTVASHAVVE